VAAASSPRSAGSGRPRPKGQDAGMVGYRTGVFMSARISASVSARL
jgi:hypothetical protein